ncbi:MAG: hypothetical protein MI725_08625 [Pirellulales bacterium]|nr:hypothetical protein [Pirellulales bacterium]
MTSEHTLDVAQRATAIYEEKLRHKLEKRHLNQFVAVEPDSGDYFVRETLSSAIQAARKVYPDRISFTLRVGHPAAVNLGVMST